jgi:hypothetical protein
VRPGRETRREKHEFAGRGIGAHFHERFAVVEQGDAAPWLGAAGNDDLAIGQDPDDIGARRARNGSRDWS